MVAAAAMVMMTIMMTTSIFLLVIVPSMSVLVFVIASTGVIPIVFTS